MTLSVVARGRRLGPFGSAEQVAEVVAELHREGCTDARLVGGVHADQPVTAREQELVLERTLELLA